MALPVPSLLSPPVLGELQQADLITSEECKRLQVQKYWHSWCQYSISHVVDVQKGKSPEVMSKTAKVLRRHGFEKESKLLAGRQLCVCLFVAVVISVYCVVMCVSSLLQFLLSFDKLT